MSKLRQDAVEAKRQVTDLTQQVDIAKSNVVDLTSELKVSVKKEQDLREHAAKIESQFREDMNRLDQIVKEKQESCRPAGFGDNTEVQGCFGRGGRIEATEERDNCL